jgi:hypothetical protein
MTQICAASTLFGAMTLAAGIDSGAVPAPAGGERILLASNSAESPELTAPWHEAPMAAGVLSRFDRVIFLNDDLRPYLPATWVPRDEDMPMLDRALRSHWALGNEPLELVAPSSSMLARIFRSADITALSVGLTGYGPLRFKQPMHVIQRLGSLAYVDLLPGVTPVALPEDDIALAPVPADAFRHVVTELVAAADDGPGPLADYSDRPTALLLGQQLSALGAISREEELLLWLEMVDAAVRHGAQRVVFKPHPAAAPAMVEWLQLRAEATGVEFVALRTPYPAEMLASAGRFDSVVSTYSTGLVTLSGMYGLVPISVGTEMLMGRLSPFASDDRIPLTIVDALTRPSAPYADAARLQGLIDAVSYCMHTGTLARLRPEALAIMTALSPEERLRYAHRPQLAELGLEPTAPARKLSPLRRLQRRIDRIGARLRSRAS